jgi:hypothetical protein
MGSDKYYPNSTDLGDIPCLISGTLFIYMLLTRLVSIFT